MSFNSLMALLVCSTVDRLDPKPTVLELGNQTLRANDRTLRIVLERLGARDEVDATGLERLIEQGEASRGERAEDYYRLLGFSDYRAIDVNDLYGSLVMDLNKDLIEAYDYRDTFSLVTNNGTGEHVFNQHTIYQNTHQLTKPGGLMIHSQPFIDYVNHGFFSIHPNLYMALAAANDYEVIAMGAANRYGEGITGFGPGAGPDPAPVLAKETRVALDVLMSEAKTLARGPRGWLKRLAGKSDARRFGAEIRRLQRTNPKLMSFSILRKRHDRPFQMPIQGIYESAVEDASLQSEYGLAATADGAKR
ncbi:MAG: hypothetical protein AAGC67_13450 [Myxococcota bacterium]